jgi:hypothetical protein
MGLAEVLGVVEQPFPGLRPFEAEDSLLFFGREPHVEQLLRNLSGSRFLAVVGTSGSGKSSLVRAGLLPALYRGYLAGSTTRWRIAVMRPGNAPLANLARALEAEEALGKGDGNRREELLKSCSTGLVAAVEDAGLLPGESVLLVVDQFEELFRYRRQAYQDDGGAEAGLFVSLLLAAAEQFDASVYIVLTMRSDFLGDCTEFPGLAEALSRSQYLIPRLTREQRRQAIERPLHLAGTRITTRSLQQLLNDSGDEPVADPLPLLQHALMRTFRHWKESGGRADLDLADYQAAGGLEGALNAHAEAVYRGLDDAGKSWAPKIFRALTGTELGRRIRRPTRLDQLYRVVGAATEFEQATINRVLAEFLKPINSLLVASSRDGLYPDTVLDIAHESLIAKWVRLEGWTRREAVSAEWYRDAVNATALFRKGEGALWRDPNLARALAFAKSEGWNEDWAAQYRPDENPGFAEVQGFLKRSQTAQRRQRVLKWAGVTVALAALLSAGTSYVREKRAEEEYRLVNAQLAQIRKQAEAKQSDIQAIEAAITKLRSERDSGLVATVEAGRREQMIQDLQAKLDSAKQDAANLKAQQEQTAKLLKEGTDVAAVNRTLLGQLAQLREQLDAANKEIERLKPRAEKGPPNAGAAKGAEVPAVKDAASAAAVSQTIQRKPVPLGGVLDIDPGDIDPGKPRFAVVSPNRIGIFDRDLAAREEGARAIDLLKEAVTEFQGALRGKLARLDLAMTQNNLGNVYLDLAGRTTNETLAGVNLELAASAYKAALKVYTRSATPWEWATATNNLGVALVRLGDQPLWTGFLTQAVTAFHDALQVRTESRRPNEWVQTMKNLARAYELQGDRTDLIETYRELQRHDPKDAEVSARIKDLTDKR